MNIPIIDLHCHSNVSDGLLSPAELIAHAAENNVQAIALTDHDDIAGLKEAEIEADRLNIIFINGVEISVTWNKRTLHIVGLNFDKEDKQLFKGLKKIRDGRRDRARLMANGLGMAGIQGAMDGAKSYAKNSTIGRIHFAQFLVAQGYAKNIGTVFKKFLTPGKPGYVEHEWISLEESIQLINDAGGDAIIAHPGRYDMGGKLYPKLFQEFKDLGGAGVEVMSGSQDPSQTNYFLKLANNFDLLSSCGSDFHGKGISHRALGNIRELPNEAIPIWTKWNRFETIFH